MSTGEQLALGFLGVFLLGPVLVKVAGVGGRAAMWLREVGVVLQPGEGLVTIPGVGGLDAARLVVIVAAVMFAVSVLLVGRRMRRRPSAGAS